MSIRLSRLHTDVACGFKLALSYFLSKEEVNVISVIADYLELVDYIFEDNFIKVIDDNGFKLHKHTEPNGVSWLHVDDQLGENDVEISIDELLKGELK